MYLDYLERIVDDYQEKRNAGKLPSALLNPTPGKIKKECMKVYKQRYQPCDRKMLWDFYEYEGDGAGFSRRMMQYPALEFLNLNLYLKGKRQDTDDKNLELLAWLIDYEGFPYDSERNYAKKEKPEKTQEQEKDDLLTWLMVQEEAAVYETPTPVIPMNKPRKKTGLIAAMIIGIMAIVGINFGLKSSGTSAITTTQGSCMVWKDGHYEKVNCDAKVIDGIAVAFDQSRYDNLKRITDISTITRDMIGKVYYRKKNNKLKFYTTGGADPEDMEGALRHMTEYIYEKYVEGEKELAKAE